MSSNGVIDSIYDFTPKALGELQAWLEVWSKAQGKGEGGVAPSGDGIKFDIFNNGGWLSVETAAKAPGGIVGQQFIADLGKISLQAYDESADIEVIAGNNVDLTANGGGIIGSAHDDVRFDANNGEIALHGYTQALLNSNGDVVIAPGAGDLVLHNITTVDPSVTDAVWSDNGTLVLSGHRAGGPMPACSLMLTASAAWNKIVPNATNKAIQWDLFDTTLPSNFSTYFELRNSSGVASSNFDTIRCKKWGAVSVSGWIAMPVEAQAADYRRYPNALVGGWLFALNEVWDRRVGNVHFSGMGTPRRADGPGDLQITFRQESGANYTLSSTGSYAFCELQFFEIPV